MFCGLRQVFSMINYFESSFRGQNGQMRMIYAIYNKNSHDKVMKRIIKILNLE